MAMYISPQTKSSKSDLKIHVIITTHVKESQRKINTVQPYDQVKGKRSTTTEK